MQKIELNLQLSNPVDAKKPIVENLPGYRHVADTSQLNFDFWPSFMGKYFTLRYAIVVTLVHDAWNVRKGHTMMFPVQIFKRPI